MNKRNFIKFKFASVLPALIVIFGLCFAAVSSYGFYLLADVDSEETVDFSQTSVDSGANEVDFSSENLDEIPPAADEKISQVVQPKGEDQHIEVVDSLVLGETRPTAQLNLKPTPTTPITKPKASPSSFPTPATTTPSPSPTPTPVVQQITLEMSIDGGSSFSLNLEQGKNHCDALNQALSEGKISSLNMQYNSSLGSFGVYQINGLGKEGQVWWVYEVNDKSPPFGCSQVQVKDGDKVKWKYIGPR